MFNYVYFTRRIKFKYYCKNVKEKATATVSLTGECADEIFAGLICGLKNMNLELKYNYKKEERPNASVFLLACIKSKVGIRYMQLGPQ